MNSSVSTACALHMLHVRNYGHMFMKDKLHLLFWESGGIISNV